MSALNFYKDMLAEHKSNVEHHKASYLDFIVLA